MLRATGEARLRRGGPGNRIFRSYPIFAGAKLAWLSARYEYGRAYDQPYLFGKVLHAPTIYFGGGTILQADAVRAGRDSIEFFYSPEISDQRRCCTRSFRGRHRRLFFRSDCYFSLLRGVEADDRPWFHSRERLSLSLPRP